MEYATQPVHNAKAFQSGNRQGTYFENPRTVVGWKGLISDPDLNGSYRVNYGLELALSLAIAGERTGSTADRHRVS